ncbi:MAG: SDR family oxidoreductase [Cyclobacteriaceae bacterium]|nr:SDR family oxidoreductase [Cyclobacteriaceae bacterium]
MTGRLCLITGGNSGIGLQTAIKLAGMGARLILTVRSEKKGNEALEKIKKQTGKDDTNFMVADLASFKQIHELSESLHSRYGHLDVLINNAGLFVTRYQRTEDGHELQLGINHLAPFLLTHLLHGLVEKSGQGRIINISSRANYKGEINFEDLYYESRYNGLKAYRQSKLANVLFTFELAGKLKNSSVTVNCLHPGVVSTGIGNRNNHSWMGWIWRMYKPFMLSEEDGAFCPVKLASDPSMTGISGKYFDYDGQPVKPNPIAFDQEIRRRLWKESERMTGFSGL